MADNLPAPTPAPDDAAPQTPSQVPDTKPAEDTPAVATISFDSFSDEEKKYLEGQGVKDFSSPEAIKKIINHAQSSQKTAAEIKAEYDKVKNLVSPQETPPNPFAPPVAPSTTPTDTPPAPDAPAKGLDQLTAYQLSNTLASQFPELKDDLVSGNFYKEMQTLGTPMLTSDGQVNIQGILKYGETAQRLRQYEAKIAEFEKPNENAIPDANPSNPPQSVNDVKMDKNVALAILSQDPNHARAAEAREFLQKQI